MPFKQTQSLSYGKEFVLKNRLHSPDMHTIASETVYNFFVKKQTNKKKNRNTEKVTQSTEIKRRFEIPSGMMNVLERKCGIFSVDIV